MIPLGVKSRVWGQDVPFLNALRNHPRYQNKINIETGIAVTDCDIIVCNYKQNGIKDVRSVQIVELKSRDAEPDYAQRSAYQVLNAFLGKKRSWLFYGVSFVSHSGDDFKTAKKYRWGRFDGDRIVWREVDYESVFDLVAMVKHPDTLRNRKLFKSHHGSNVVTMEVTTPLGFQILQTIVKKY